MFWKNCVRWDVLARSLAIYIYANIKYFHIISNSTCCWKDSSNLKKTNLEGFLNLQQTRFFSPELEGPTSEESQEMSVQIGKDQLSIVEKVSWITLPKF